MSFEASPTTDEDWTDADSDVRQEAMAELFDELGASLDIPELSLDKDNVVRLEIEDRALVLEYLSGSDGIVLQSALRLGAREPELALFEVLNATNGVGHAAGLGIVTLDLDSGQLVWSDRLSTAGLTAEALEESVRRAVSRVLTWEDLLRDLLKAAATPAAVEVEEPIETAGFSAQQHLIRI